MTLVREHSGTRPIDLVVPPWEIAPYGVVSLLAMLDFAAVDFLEISYKMGLILGEAKRPTQSDPNVLGDSLSLLLENCGRLGLKVTALQIWTLMNEIAKRSPDSVKLEKVGDRVDVHVAAQLDPDRSTYHLEALYTTLRAEIGSHMFKAIPTEKDRYCDVKWLVDSAIHKNFPEAWKEFQSAGRCYAYGENTACAFHLNRALEWGLKSLAVHLGKRFDRNSWKKHLEDIEKELKARYGAAGPRTPEEKFYSEAAAQFGNMKVAWRNPTMHIERSYDDREGLYLLVTVDKFIDHLASNDLKEVRP